MSSVAEAELGALFDNARLAVEFRLMLTEMGHPQPRHPFKLTTPLPLALVMELLRYVAPAPSTCVSIGYAIAPSKVISPLSGCPKHTTLLII